MYREDADVAWRAQLMGWRCLYTPLACGYHVRNVLPGKRHALPPEINMHSVKNRFLMRIKNMTPDLYRRNLISIIGTRSAGDRRLSAARALLPQGLRLCSAELEDGRWKRREIMRRRRVQDEYLASWFSFKPVSRPAPKPSARAVARARAGRG